MAQAKRIVLASRPEGEPKASDFRLEEYTVPNPGAGEVLLRTIWLSLDPYMRGRMSEGPSYAQPVPIGGHPESAAIGSPRAITPAGARESHVHDVTITKEAPNDRSEEQRLYVGQGVQPCRTPRPSPCRNSHNPNLDTRAAGRAPAGRLPRHYCSSLRRPRRGQDRLRPRARGRARPRPGRRQLPHFHDCPGISRTSPDVRQHVDSTGCPTRSRRPRARDLPLASTVMAIEWAERLDVMPRGTVVEVRLEHDGDARRIDAAWT